jgi:hypothetical protein
MPKAISYRLIVAKKKMQDVDFKNVDDLLAFLPEDELKIVERLRKIIFSCLPGCTGKLAYNVPFYKVHANICFIWPPSVKWGGKGHEGVRFGFTKGYLLTDEIGYLDRGTRKQVYWRDFYSMKDIEAEILRAYIFVAALVDEEVMSNKNKRNHP